MEIVKDPQSYPTKYITSGYFDENPEVEINNALASNSPESITAMLETRRLTEAGNVEETARIDAQLEHVAAYIAKIA